MIYKKFSKELILAINAAYEAGRAIIQIYNNENFDVSYKDDQSPITKADKKSHEIITKVLQETNLPIFSEEGSKSPFKDRSYWKKYWLIDPIDGTKEFISKNGEFTVNIALIINNKPELGVVLAPCFNEIYFAESNLGSFKITEFKNLKSLKNGKIINLNKIVKNKKEYNVVISRSHINSETLDYIKMLKNKYKVVNTLKFGSSLKICKVADGSANCYPRFGPTMEWDIAAAHVIADLAGCSVTQKDEKSKITYNKKNLLNPSFIVKKN